ncbi:DnaA ATPase domain-containing protein [Yoonia litorea]|uniref:DnaA protein n=1 Tax=Yoonia litorea TaxID=1123755 RepID=A0A1I6LJM8_9RHOB|nr:DnaA/Hda family protein [Yoonia litorea]SFS03522.1 dnaA protein [Yoonia litorea]
MADQLAFEWPSGVARGPDDFFVSEANAKAFAMISAPESWPDRKLVLTGPTGAGKSHLAGIFRNARNAELFSAETLPVGHQTEAAAVVVEDAESLPSDREETLFHLHNNLRATGGLLLLTSDRPPSRWPIALPDLASRMQATTVIEIDNPDDALLSALIMKLFADRQISPKPDLVRYLATRLERSHAAAAHIVAELDRAALAQGRKINKTLAAELLDKQA